MEIISQEIIPVYNPAYTHVWTYSDVLDALSTEFLYQLFRLSIVFLGLELICLWYRRGLDLPAWKDYSKMSADQKKNKIFSAAVMISVIPSVYFPVIIILYKFGIVI